FVPELVDVPAGVVLKSIEMTEPAQKIETDLWRMAWTATLNIEKPDDLTPSGQLDLLQFVVRPPQTGALQSHDQIVCETRLNRRIDVPISYPNRIHFGQMPVNSSRTRTLFLSASDEIPFELALDADSLPGELAVSL